MAPFGPALTEPYDVAAKDSNILALAGAAGGVIRETVPLVPGRGQTRPPSRGPAQCSR